MVKIKKEKKNRLTRSGGSNQFPSLIENLKKSNTQIISDDGEVYEIIDTIAKGTFGRIWKIKNEDNEYYVLKEIVNNRERDLNCYPKNEIEIIKEIKKQQENDLLNCVIEITDIGPFYRYIPDFSPKSNNFRGGAKIDLLHPTPPSLKLPRNNQTQNNQNQNNQNQNNQNPLDINCYITEKYDTDLFDYIDNTANNSSHLWNKENVDEFCKKIIQIIGDLHEKNIYHRDLKCEQIFLNYNNKVDKIANIDTCVIGDLDDLISSNDIKICNEIIGTLDYLPPEYILSHCLPLIDIYDSFIFGNKNPYDFFISGIINRIIGDGLKYENHLDKWIRLINPHSNKKNINSLQFEVKIKNDHFYNLCLNLMNWLVNDLKLQKKYLNNREFLRIFIYFYFSFISVSTSVNNDKLDFYMGEIFKNLKTSNDINPVNKKFIYEYVIGNIDIINKKIYEDYDLDILQWCKIDSNPRKNDLWAQGIILYLIITQNMPYTGAANLANPSFIDFIFNLNTNLKYTSHYYHFLRILISPSFIRESEKINKESLLNLFMNPQNVDIFLHSLQESISRQGQIESIFRQGQIESIFKQGQIKNALNQNIKNIISSREASREASRESSRKSSIVNNQGINPNNLKKSLMPPNGAVFFNASKKRKNYNKNQNNRKKNANESKKVKK